MWGYFSPFVRSRRDTKPSSLGDAYLCAEYQGETRDMAESMSFSTDPDESWTIITKENCHGNGHDSDARKTHAGLQQSVNNHAGIGTKESIYGSCASHFGTAQGQEDHQREVVLTASDIAFLEAESLSDMPIYGNRYDLSSSILTVSEAEGLANMANHRRQIKDSFQTEHVSAAEPTFQSFKVHQVVSGGPSQIYQYDAAVLQAASDFATSGEYDDNKFIGNDIRPITFNAEIYAFAEQHSLHHSLRDAALGKIVDRSKSLREETSDYALTDFICATGILYDPVLGREDGRKTFILEILHKWLPVLEREDFIALLKQDNGLNKDLMRFEFPDAAALK